MLCKIWGFHGSDYEECCLLGYKNQFPTSQETHYFSVTESSPIMLCKIWGFHGSDHEECRLLGYKNPVRTSQETHYLSATELSQLMLCKIWGFHGSDYEGAQVTIRHAAGWAPEPVCTIQRSKNSWPYWDQSPWYPVHRQLLHQLL
jgi:hypothetical protein